MEDEVGLGLEGVGADVAAMTGGRRRRRKCCISG